MCKLLLLVYWMCSSNYLWIESFIILLKKKMEECCSEDNCRFGWGLKNLENFCVGDCLLFVICVLVLNMMIFFWFVGKCVLIILVVSVSVSCLESLDVVMVLKDWDIVVLIFDSVKDIKGW